MTTTATPAELLRSRLRRYFAVVFGLFVGAIVLLVALGAVVKLAGVDKKSAGLIIGIAAPLVMLGVVISSWIAVSKLWRCPACEKNIYWLVSWQMSLFAASASTTCPSCGVELFTPAANQRRRRLFLVLVALGVIAGLGGAATAGFVDAKKRQQQQQQQVQPPPPPPPPNPG
jgi:cytochrome c biogenesis factor